MKAAANQKITTFLMFEGDAEEAMTFYLSLFDDAEVVNLTRYGVDGPGKERTVQQATFTPAAHTVLLVCLTKGWVSPGRPHHSQRLLRFPECVVGGCSRQRRA